MGGVLKNVVYFVSVIVIGALLGSFLGKFLAIYVPAGNVHDLFATDISAGLRGVNLDLHLVEIHFTALLHFNFTSLLGMFAAALLFKTVVK